MCLSDSDLLARSEAIHDSIAENPSYFNPVVDTGFGGMKSLPERIAFVDTGALSTDIPIQSRSLRLPPLVCLNKDGKPYTRPPRIEAELRRIFRLNRSQWVGIAPSLQNETLVCIIRLTHDQDLTICGGLIETLQVRVRYRAERFCSEMDEYDKQMFVDNVELQVLELVLAKDPGNAEWGILEVAFGLAVKNLALNELEKFKNSTAGHIADLHVDANLVDGIDEGEEVERPIEFVQGTGSGPEGNLLNLDMRQHRHRLLHKALQAVSDPRHRKAAILHWGRGMPVYSCKRGKKCLTRYFRKDERMIWTWLETAMKQMRAALGVKKNSRL
jgi:hypothetical protein